MKRLLAIGAVFATGLAGIATATEAHAASGPPYTECPAVGNAASCGILLQVNADRTITVVGDPSVGPYDGADDTLVGIVNNSAKPVDAIVVSGTGTGLAGFDNDGLCTYISCTWPAPTGYEGPGTSFVTDPATLDKVEVDFSGGLEPGKSGYFSLEGQLDAAVIKASPGTISNKMAALGDSFSSGEGNAPFEPGTNTASDKCHRSTAAYGPKISQLYYTHPTLDSSHFVACSGSITNDLFAPNHANPAEPRQLDGIPSDARLVTLTIGGNDLGFVNVLSDCLAKGTIDPNPNASCAHDRPAKDAAKALTALSGGAPYKVQPDPRKSARYPVHSWSSVIQAIHAKAPSAQILIAGYPHLVDPKGPGFNGLGWCFMGWAAPSVNSPLAVPVWISRPSAAWLARRVDAADSALSRAVSHYPYAHYVDVAPYFTGRSLCDSHPWLYKISVTGQFVDRYGDAVFNTSSGSAHPDQNGQLLGYERAFADELNRLP